MISFKNKQLASYLMFKLDKLENQFDFEELGQIDEVMLNVISEDGDLVDIDFTELFYLKNLKSIPSFLQDKVMALKEWKKSRGREETEEEQVKFHCRR